MRIGFSRSWPFRLEMIMVLLLLYILAGGLLMTQVGPWTAVRHTVINGLIVAAWLGSSALILRGTPVPPLPKVRRPRFELAWMLIGLITIAVMAAASYGNWWSQPRRLVTILMYIITLLPFLVLRYPLVNLGLLWPPQRAWLALLAVILINIAAAIVFQVLPRDILPAETSGDLSQGINSPWSAMLLFVNILLVAAIPEELFFRVSLIPRLATYLPVGWAILIQALLFSALHLPQRVVGYGEPWLAALGYLLAVDNGIIGGYLWWRTRSLPLLVLLHLFAYARFGI